MVIKGGSCSKMIIKFLLFDYKKRFKNYLVLGFLSGLYIYFWKDFVSEELSLGDFCIVFLIGICIYHLSTFASDIASQHRYLIFSSPKINGKTFVLTKFIRVFSDAILFFVVVFLTEMVTNLARRQYKSEIILFIKNLFAQKTNKLIDIIVVFILHLFCNCSNLLFNNLQSHTPERISPKCFI